MKNLKTSILIISLLAFLSVPALAQTKIATVDMGNLFTNYWKTKQAQASIDDRRTQLTKDDKTMQADLKKLTAEYQKLLQQANDQAISADERARRQQAANDKLKEVQDSRTALEQYERGAATTLNDQKLRMRAKILDDIQEHVTAVAKAGGYTLVLDKAAQAASATSVVVYSVPEIDLTAKVLKQLNANAPIDVTGASSPVLSSPVPSLVNTNGP